MVKPMGLVTFEIPRILVQNTNLHSKGKRSRLGAKLNVIKC